MNRIEEMLEMQKMLDKQIEKEHNVEIDEINLICAIIDELGELNHALKGKWCWWKKTQKPVDKKEVLGELVDVWHFVLSYHYHYLEEETTDEKYLIKAADNTITIMKMMELSLKLENMNVDLQLARYQVPFSKIIEKINQQGETGILLSHAMVLTYALDFTFDDVYEAYKEKNKVNYERLRNGY